MAGGPAFLRPPDELTTRLCFVDFDGEKALKESHRIGLGTALPESFVKEHCDQIYDGIKVKPVRFASPFQQKGGPLKGTNLLSEGKYYL